MFNLKVTEAEKASAVIIYKYEQNSIIERGELLHSCSEEGRRKPIGKQIKKIKKNLQMYLHKQWRVSGELRQGSACVETERN